VATAAEPQTAEPPAERQTAEPPAKRQGRIFHLRSAFAMSGAMLTAMIALISGGLALLFQLRPDIIPDPRTHLGASTSVFAVDSDVTLGSFLKRRKAIVSAAEYKREKQGYLKQARAASGGPSNKIFMTPGEDVFVRLLVEGFKARSITMLASMYDAQTGRRVPQVDNVPVFAERLDSPSDRSVVEFWLPAPPASTRSYFIRIAVYHRNDGVLLAVADSDRVVAS